ncbi:MAG: hypothetical protein KAT00_02860, partial [Planctomycetes bacterium]|nr:hypothetical protein [Planctomycetota bacterium]
YYKWSVPLEYELFCAEKYPESESIEYLWLDENVPLLANSIVLTDKILWVAGAPDVVDEVAAMEHWAMDPGDPAYDPNIPAKLAEQDAALNDERGGRLRAVLISDGSIMADYSIESLPVWDGMVAANGRLYISLKNGKVVCFVGTNYPPIIDVGSDRSVFPMGPAMLDATVTDDGIPLTDPDDPCSLPVGVTSKWITLSGPGTVTFDDANSVDTTAEFSERGEYTLRLDAFDGSAYYYNDLNLKVLRPGDMDADDDVDEFDLDDFIGGWMFDDCGWHNDWCAGANQSGSGFVGSDSFAVMAVNWLLGVEPDAPVELTATSGATQISLDWEDNDEADLAGYNVYRSLSTGGAYTKINSSLVIDSSFIDTGAANLLTYFYVVTAVDDIGYESLSYSNEVRAAAGVQPGVKLIASLDIIQDVNDLVRRWNDQANSNDAIQSTGGWRPAY